MKLEEILLHLRNGGKVWCTDSFKNTTYDLNQVFELHVDILKSDLFEIVKEPYKKETIVHVNPEYYGCYSIEGNNYFNLKDLLPKIKTGQITKYKVIIEEIE